MRYPLVFLALTWLVGLIVGSFLIYPSSFLWLSIGLSLLIFIFSLQLFKKQSKYWLILLGLVILFLGLLRMQYQLNQYHSQLSGSQVRLDHTIGLKGYLITEPKIQEGKAQFVVNPTAYLLEGGEKKAETKEKLLIYLYLNGLKQQNEVQEWKKGQGIRLYGTLKKPHSLVNPGLFDYENYLNKQGIYWILEVSNDNKITVTKGISDLSLTSSLRKILNRQIDKLYSQPYTGFMKSILLGGKEELDPDILSNFSFLGLSHLLAISGLHLSIFASMIYWLLSKLKMTKETVSLITMVIIVGYMFLTGASTSVVRATVMTVLTLYGLIYHRTFQSLQALGFSFIIMTFINPNWIYQIGFQLSYLVTFFILWAYPKLVKKLPITSLKIRQHLSLLVVTQIASLPLILHYFHQYSFFSWLSNLFVVPIFSFIILPLGIISLALSFLYPIANLLAYIVSSLLHIIFWLVEWLSGYTNFILVGRFSSFLSLLYGYLFIIWMLSRGSIKASFLSYQTKRVIGYFEKGLIGLLIFATMITFFNKSALITMLDVGQGDSILIETPSHQAILMDSGGKITFAKEDLSVKVNEWEIGEDVIIPYIHSRGFKELQMAVLTHEDQDHIGGFFSIIDHIPIKTFVVSNTFPRTEEGRKLETKLKEKRIPILYIDNVRAIYFDVNTQAVFIYLGHEFSQKENDHSLIVVFKIYNNQLLFTGDIEEIGEDELLKRYRMESINILKVAHHGSKTSTSTELIKQSTPNDAIISVGENNPYNHPADQVINRLEKEKINIFRTDKNGAIKIKINRNGYIIETTKDD